jgi:hypothetical protein
MAGPHQFQLTPGGVPLGAEFAPGRHYFVKPYGGLDGNRGDDANRPLDTLTAALAKVNAGSFDTVHFFGHGNDTSADGTDYRTTALGGLALNKDSVRWIAHHKGQGSSWLSPRARIAPSSTAINASPTVTLSGDSQVFDGFQVYAGTATDTAASVALSVTGTRNLVRGCHLAGIGSDVADTFTGSCSLAVSGLENEFHDNVIGLTTVDRGTAINSEIHLASGRTLFKNCRIIMRATATTHLAVQASGLSDVTLFENCTFYNWGTATMAEAFSLSGTSGIICLKSCTAFGITEWNAAHSAYIKICQSTCYPLT